VVEGVRLRVERDGLAKDVLDPLEKGAERGGVRHENG
jgi:hypothetical protein